VTCGTAVSPVSRSFHAVVSFRCVMSHQPLPPTSHRVLDDHSTSAYIRRLTRENGPGGSCVRFAVPRLASACRRPGGVVTPTYATTPARTMRIQIHDQCNAATFNAALGGPVCSGMEPSPSSGLSPSSSACNSRHDGSLSQVNCKWSFGQSFVATNLGGETYTFTEVKSFGEGAVPFLNQWPARPPSGRSAPTGCLTRLIQDSSSLLLPRWPPLSRPRYVHRHGRHERRRPARSLPVLHAVLHRPHH